MIRCMENGFELIMQTKMVSIWHKLTVGVWVGEIRHWDSEARACRAHWDWASRSSFTSLHQWAWKADGWSPQAHLQHSPGCLWRCSEYPPNPGMLNWEWDTNAIFLEITFVSFCLRKVKSLHVNAVSTLRCVLTISFAYKTAHNDVPMAGRRRLFGRIRSTIYVVIEITEIHWKGCG